MLPCLTHTAGPEDTCGCSSNCNSCLSICPHGPFSQDEDQIARNLFQNDATGHLDSLGLYRACYQGRVADDKKYMQAPCGGLCTDLLSSLLERNRIDSLVLPIPLKERPWFESRLIHTKEELAQAGGSVYHCTPMDLSLRDIIFGKEETRTAVVALPCVAKAIRNLQLRFPTAKRRIKFVVGLVCGGLRARSFADFITGFIGIKEGRLFYRRTLAGQKDSYHTRIEMLAKDKAHSRSWYGIPGHFWVYEAASLSGCHYCDDIFCETADIVYMEAFLPEFLNDSRGRNLIITRNKELDDVVQDCFRSKRWQGDLIDPQRVATSQYKPLYKRRSRVPARIRLARQNNDYVPQKRLDLCEKFISPSFTSKAQDRQAKREFKFFSSMRGKVTASLKQLRSVNPRTSRRAAFLLWWSTLCCAAWYGVFEKVFSTNLNKKAEHALNSPATQNQPEHE